MNNKLVPRGLSAKELYEAGELVIPHMERIAQSLAIRHSTLTLQRAYLIVLVVAIGIAMNVGGPYDRKFQALFDEIKALPHDEVEEAALPGLSDNELQEAGESIVPLFEPIVDDLATRYPVITIQRALVVVVTAVITLAIRVGGPHDKEFHGFLDFLKSELIDEPPSA
jgi:hypothetical protein